MYTKNYQKKKIIYTYEKKEEKRLHIKLHKKFTYKDYENLKRVFIFKILFSLRYDNL